MGPLLSVPKSKCSHQDICIWADHSSVDLYSCCQFSILPLLKMNTSKLWETPHFLVIGKEWQFVCSKLSGFAARLILEIFCHFGCGGRDEGGSVCVCVSRGYPLHAGVLVRNKSLLRAIQHSSVFCIAAATAFPSFQRKKKTTQFKNHKKKFLSHCTSTTCSKSKDG